MKKPTYVSLHKIVKEYEHVPGTRIDVDGKVTMPLSVLNDVAAKLKSGHPRSKKFLTNTNA